MTLPAFAQLPAGDLVLASASAIRAKILHDAGLGYRCYPVAIDEDSVRASASAEAVPIGDIAILGDFHRAEHGQINVPAADHCEGLRRVEIR